MFFGGHFTRVELLEVLGLTPLFLPRAICFGLIWTARYVLSYLNISSGRTKFEIFREQVGYLYILYYYARPECLINCCKSCYSLSRVSYLSFSGFARDSCSFPYRKTVIERRCYVSCINIIELFDHPVCSFWNCKSEGPVSVTTALHVVYDIAEWFCSGKSSEIWSSSCDQVIVHPALCCGRHCFWMQGCQVFLGLLSVHLRFCYRRKLTKPCRSGNTAISILLDLINFR